MTAYYNEFDPYAAQWLRNLIAAGHIAPGDVDERSILEIKPDDVRKYTQAHFFAGIGGWSRALRLAAWDDGRSVWTGSCPCQPFSFAGKQKAQQDERHLWPIWFKLIAEVHPSVVFGEQVAGAIAHGWLDDAFDDLERQGYETGAAVLPACSVWAPHKRDRLWFVAHADANQQGSQGRDGGIMQERPSQCTARTSSASICDSPSQGLHASSSTGIHSREKGAGTRHVKSERPNWWQFEPGMGRVANGIPARVGKLRAYGNAIVPQVAAEFINAYQECRA